MVRAVYDSWEIPIDNYNRTTPFYVQCDCGKLARKVYQHSYFDCPECDRRYVPHAGTYVEVDKNK